MTNHAARLTAPLHRPARKGLLARIMDWDASFRHSVHMSRLSNHLLKDAGLTRQEAAEEAKRAMWDAPQHWKR